MGWYFGVSLSIPLSRLIYFFILACHLSQGTSNLIPLWFVFRRQHTPQQLYNRFTFTFMHLADAFIQSDLQCIQAIHFCQYACSLGIEPTTFCAANAMLYHWAKDLCVNADRQKSGHISKFSLYLTFKLYFVCTIILHFVWKVFKCSQYIFLK